MGFCKAVNNEEIERPKTIRDLIEQGYALEEQKKSPKKTVAEIARPTHAKRKVTQ